MDELIRKSGSFRRLMEQYWTGQLTPEQERLIEDNRPKLEISSFKPIPNKVITPELSTEKIEFFATDLLRLRGGIHGQSVEVIVRDKHEKELFSTKVTSRGAFAEAVRS